MFRDPGLPISYTLLLVVLFSLSGKASGGCLESILVFMPHPSVWSEAQQSRIQTEMRLHEGGEFFSWEQGENTITPYPGSDLTFLTRDEAARLLTFVTLMIGRINESYGHGEFGELKLEFGEIRIDGPGNLTGTDSDGFHNHLGGPNSGRRITVTTAEVGGPTVFRCATCPENAAAVFSDEIDHRLPTDPQQGRLIVILSLVLRK